MKHYRNNKYQNQLNKPNNIKIIQHIIITIKNNQRRNNQKKFHKNKAFQSNRKVIIIDIPSKVIIFQSIKYIKSFMIKKTQQKQQNQPKRNKNKYNKTNRHKHKSNITSISSAPQTNIFT